MIFFIGTFHKTGTVLLLNLLKIYCKKNLNTRIINLSSDMTKIPIQRLKLLASDKKNQTIIFNDHFDNLLNKNINLNELEKHQIKYRGIVLIRHPYEIIMSGMRYHQTTKEQWCQKPLEEFENQSYQEIIKNLPTQEDKIKFEMENCSYQTISAILQTKQQTLKNDKFKYIKLEDLTIIQPQKTIKIISKHLNIDQEQLNNIFKKLLKEKKTSSHITNKSNNIYTYHENFTEQHYKKFNQLFSQSILQQLGYAPVS